MSLIDKLKTLLVKHDTKVGKAVDQAARMADRKTRGKYSRQIHSGSRKARDAVERISDERRRDGGGTGGAPGAGPRP
ncbi:antitoxin [Streptomyces sp. TRM 70351]|uniref:antitoxin n=1 Tax=Streptomyces sp. TRM 70351 TaxID=3116552 RepID=UPI002E7B4067|nr:antitoxin [Streptomyces sp. TRM 70351]MEE1926603.1 antitoxin [Streptomyces sp. TRM 70351]